MLASLSDNTISQYDPCIKKWFFFCQETNIDFFTASAPEVLRFLTNLFDHGCKYGSINSAKSAITLLVGSDTTNDLRVKRFMKGIYKLRTPLPKYSATWDPGVVLNWLSNHYPNEGLAFDLLTKKLITLLALITAHRVQTLSLIRVSNIKLIHNEKFVIKIPDTIKTSALGRSQPLLIIPYFNEKPSICPARTLEQYLKITAQKRQSNCEFLFVSLKKPYKNVCGQSLSRWIKATLQESGIDTSVFSAHSTRHASVSAANKLGVSIDVIKRTAGWTGNSSSFARFYSREVLTESPESFARSLCGLASTQD